MQVYHRKHIWLKVTGEGNQQQWQSTENGSTRWWVIVSLHETWHITIFLPLVILPLPISKQPKRSWAKCSYTCWWEKEKKKKNNQNPNYTTKSQLHKREYAWTWDATRDREMHMKQRKLNSIQTFRHRY